MAWLFSLHCSSFQSLSPFLRKLKQFCTVEIVDTLAQQYAEKYTTPEDPLLKEISEYTYAHHEKAHMLSGHLQGSFLEMVSSMLQPVRILEIGTFTGYSALCLAKGLAPNGQLHTIEVRNEDAATAKGY